MMRDAREAKFRAGAHHTARCLADAIGRARTLKDARRIADAVVIAVEHVRCSDAHFDIHQIVADATTTHTESL